MANEMRDKLFELLTDCEIEYAQYLSEECDKAIKGDVTKQLFKRLEFYADRLIENGVVLPPCYIGQRVWKKFKWFNGNVEIQEGKVSMLQQKADKSWKIRVSIGSSVQDFKVEDIGKTVFLTKEEAEQKLKEMRGNDG